MLKGAFINCNLVWLNSLQGTNFCTEGIYLDRVFPHGGLVSTKFRFG